MKSFVLLLGLLGGTPGAKKKLIGLLAPLLALCWVTPSCGSQPVRSDGGTLGDAGASIGTIDFELRFLVAALGTGTCQWALVPNIRLQFLDQALDSLLRTEITRPCVPGERYRVSVDAGPYNIRAQGINAALSICYEVNQLYTVIGGRTEVLTVTAPQRASGPAAGCLYPTTPPP